MIPYEIGYRRALKAADFIFRDKRLAAGVPPLKVFFEELTQEEKFLCFRAGHEISKIGTEDD